MTDKNKKETLPQFLQTDVRCRFFSQYFNQEVALIPSYPYGNDLIKAKVYIIKEIQYLELKSLSKITDEEIIRVANYLDIQFSSAYSDEFVISEYRKAIKSPENLSAVVFDFLRSKGYALPFMEYSVEDLISFGWVQLL